ncbi:MAG: hypothetical protein FJ128_11800 [Deltaproteobacteria bacterium]|nr:hypothetical protein [Deltaproteobacteria bacterium]
MRPDSQKDCDCQIEAKRGSPEKLTPTADIKISWKSIIGVVFWLWVLFYFLPTIFEPFMDKNATTQTNQTKIEEKPKEPSLKEIVISSVNNNIF